MGSSRFIAFLLVDNFRNISTFCAILYFLFKMITAWHLALYLIGSDSKLFGNRSLLNFLDHKVLWDDAVCLSVRLSQAFTSDRIYTGVLGYLGFTKGFASRFDT